LNHLVWLSFGNWYEYGHCKWNAVSVKLQEL
jgi:hypothetical protein